MNNNLEKNKPEKNRVRKRNSYVDTTERRLRDGGFIAWPEPRTLIKKQASEIEIIEGRSKKGGFIAFPKLKS